MTKDLVILAIHMDDMAWFASSCRTMDQAKAEVSSEFPCKDLGPIKHLLGLEVT